MSKIDVADAFCQINLNPADFICMGVLFLSKKEKRKLIGFPLVLPMGWAESPPAFCAGTETIADLANASLTINMQSLDVSHRLDVFSKTVLETAITKKRSKFIAQTNYDTFPVPFYNQKIQVFVSRRDLAPHLMSKTGSVGLQTDLDLRTSKTKLSQWDQRQT